MNEKENLGASLNDMEDKGNSSFAISNLRQEKNILTEELVFLNKELSKLRVCFGLNDEKRLNILIDRE